MVRDFAVMGLEKEVMLHKQKSFMDECLLCCPAHFFATFLSLMCWCFKHITEFGLPFLLPHFDLMRKPRAEILLTHSEARERMLPGVYEPHSPQQSQQEGTIIKSSVHISIGRNNVPLLSPNDIVLLVRIIIFYTHFSQKRN